MEVTSTCKVVGNACIYRPHSGLSASSSAAPLRSGNSLSNCRTEGLVQFTPWDVLLSRPRVQRRLNSPLTSRKDESGFPISGRGQTRRASVATLQGFDDSTGRANDLHEGKFESSGLGEMWDPLQARRIVVTGEASGGGGSFHDPSLNRFRNICVAAISAQTYQPPVQDTGTHRSQMSNYITGGVLFTVFAWIVWVITKTEQYARKALVSPEETLVTPPPAPEMVEQYERAKASVSQAALVNDALAAVRNNDLIKCTVVTELALEANRIARSSIESDFFDEGELLQVYRGVIKVWLDGYPLDYGRILQLRGLLDVPSKEAEDIEQAVQQQSDAYVI
ncbi:hypothetical protein R1sor_020869 [Riccia sorocarpa]|uniref:Uncharacterized protein n=1 Tax=Riccia sorocarpa TaxID=122646 RepID=A0ABD3GFG0_9MARC